MKSRNILLLFLVLLAMATRLMPHWPNFTAVGAVALFSGSMFSRKVWAFGVPLLAIFLSDLVLNNVVYASGGFVWFTQGFYWIYAAFALSVLLGRYGMNARKGSSVLLSGVASALVFFLITNFGDWLGDPLYAQNFAGLLASYTAGLPFLGNQVLGNFFYTAVLFGLAHCAVPSYRLRSLA